jgi:hypothetical protein
MNVDRLSDEPASIILALVICPVLSIMIRFEDSKEAYELAC